MQPFKRLHLQLTAWYVGTFTIILLLLASALFVLLSNQLSGDLDLRLATSVAATRRAMEVRQAFGTPPEQALRDAIREIAQPDRPLYLFGRDGKPIAPSGAVDPRVMAAAADALAGEDEVSAEFRTGASQRWRLYAERVAPGGGETFVVVAVADATGFRKQFERLLETFIAAALLALLPVGFGGYHIARVAAARVERAMRQLRDFTADAAHELRTPVSIIRGHAELAVEREREAAAYAAALREIAVEAERLGRLVDNLLTLARAEAGERGSRRERLFLDDIADEAVEGAAVLGAGRGVSVTLGRFEETIVTGDPELLRQVLIILLDNAVKFTPNGGSVRLDVFVEDLHPTVVVEDTGLGIAPEHLPHVFERFFRGDRSRTRVAGAGLGLAIARWILEQHSATIVIKSAPDRGTRIHVRFPVASAPSSRAPRPL
ncbi:MAG: sensor histidine kinase [Gemmatimonadales bacterium]